MHSDMGVFHTKSPGFGHHDLRVFQFSCMTIVFQK